MKLFRKCDVAEMLDVGESAIAKWIREGKFPPPVILPNGQKRWIESEIEEWLKSLITAKSVVAEIPPNDSQPTSLTPEGKATI